MAINKIPTIEYYWECGQYGGNEAIRNIMSRTRFEQILNFANNQKDKRFDKAYKVRSIISYFNDSLVACSFNDSTQSVDERMVTFNGRSSMRQYVKNKPIKWGFKFWYAALVRLDIYTSST